MLIQVDDIREPEEKLFAMMEVCDRLAKETGSYITGGDKAGICGNGGRLFNKGGKSKSGG